MRILTDIEIGYLAGIIDGEGYLTIAKRPCKEMCRGVSYAPMLVVTNTNKSLLDCLLTITGYGAVRPAKRKSSPNHKTRYNWVIWAGGLKILLPLILPVLICKKEQAELVSQFMKNTKLGRRLLDSEWAAREELYQKVKQLNARGVKA